KALRNCLAFIAVLANYEPTPAEEIEGMFENNEKDITSKPSKQVETEPIPDIPGAPMTPAQDRLIQKILKSRYLSEDERKGYTEDYQTGMSKDRATKFISWWLGEKEKGIMGERDKREKASRYSEKQKEIIEIAKEGGINSRNALLKLLKEKKIIGETITYEELMKLIDTNQDKYEQIKAFLSSWVLGNLSIEDKNE
ncbi:MAG TPA: hypothetical protein DEG96_06895, partial [Candidatus Atribacteria bacterium]|nr:hypothetical protein [Candidatus Atribacteria bacterium]